MLNYLFGANLVQKSKIFYENWYLTQFEVLIWNQVQHFKNFDRKLFNLGKFVPKIKTVWFLMKIGTWLNLRVLISNPVQNSRPPITLFGQICSKNWKCSTLIKTGSQFNLKNLNLIQVLDFKDLYHILSYLGKFAAKIKNCLFCRNIGTWVNLRVLIVLAYAIWVTCSNYTKIITESSISTTVVRTIA